MSTDVHELEGLLAAAGTAERLPLLNALGMALSRVDARRGLGYAAEAEALALEIGDVAGCAESRRVAAWCHETLSEYAEAMRLARAARMMFARAGERTGEGNSLIAIGVIAFGMAGYAEALEALGEARTIFVALENQPRLASALNNIGMVCQTLGRFPEALEAYLEALAINERMGDEALAATNLSNVSNVYYYLGDTERSYRYDLRALEAARRLGDEYSVAHRLESIASNHKARGDHEAAHAALAEALAIFCRLGERRYEAAALVKLGSLLELRGQNDLALEHYERSAEIAAEIGRAETEANALLFMGMAHARDGHHEKAREALLRGLERSREAGMAKLECDILGTLAASLAAIGEAGEAFQRMREHAERAEVLYGEARQRAMAEMQARFDVERAEREREVLRLRNEHLEEMMELRTRELTAMAMRLVRKNAFLQKLRKETARLATGEGAVKDALDAVQRDIVENLHGDDEWERFEREFGRIHHDFLERLSSRFPRLTPAELKVCAMLKINLSNKEIASLLSVSLRNVESHRYSIRKKLGLPSDANLTASLVGM